MVWTRGFLFPAGRGILTFAWSDDDDDDDDDSN
jgi:hypothetical protein